MDPEEVRANRPEGAIGPVSVALQGLHHPVVVILLLAGFFDAISGNPIQGLVLGVVAAALALDPDRDLVLPRRDGTTPSRARRSTVPLAFAAALFAVWVGGFARYSWPATIAVIVPGVAAVALAWTGPLAGAPEPVRPTRRGTLSWAGVFVGLSLWELAALLMQPSLRTDSAAHPTISVLSDAVLATHPGRYAMLFAWLVLGWFLVGR